MDPLCRFVFCETEASAHRLLPEGYYWIFFLFLRLSCPFTLSVTQREDSKENS